ELDGLKSPRRSWRRESKPSVLIRWNLSGVKPMLFRRLELSPEASMRNRVIALFIGVFLIAVAAVVLSKGMFAMNEARSVDERTNPDSERSAGAEVKLEKATFGSGCFWCTEAVFQQLKGVHSVVSGYSGGNVPNPTYQEVCTGTTGHAEVVQVT